MELKDKGTDVLVLSPGLTETEGLRGAKSFDISKLPKGSNLCR